MAVNTDSDYCTLANLKTRLGIGDTTDDAVLSALIVAASRFIDNYCGRRFYTTTNDEVRYYTAQYGAVLLPPDDVISITELATDIAGERLYEEVWETTDFDLEPPNATVDQVPFSRLMVTPLGNYSFPVGLPRGVRITGKFGYPCLPQAVSEAALLVAQNLFRRKDAPLGVWGSGELGQVVTVPGLDRTVMFLVASYRKVSV